MSVMVSFMHFIFGLPFFAIFILLIIDNVEEYNSWHVSLIVKYLEEDVVQNEIVIIINNVVEFDIQICNFNSKTCWGGWMKVKED